MTFCICTIMYCMCRIYRRVLLCSYRRGPGNESSVSASSLTSFHKHRTTINNITGVVKKYQKYSFFAFATLVLLGKELIFTNSGPGRESNCGILNSGTWTLLWTVENNPWGYYKYLPLFYKDKRKESHWKAPKKGRVAIWTIPLWNICLLFSVYNTIILVSFLSDKV